MRGGGEVVAPAPRETHPGVGARRARSSSRTRRRTWPCGLGDDAEAERPLEATLWGEPRLGHTAVRLADGTKIAWRRGVLVVDRDREVTFAER